MEEPLSSKPTTLSRVAGLVAAILEQNHAPRAVAPDERLVDAGLTSMDMVHLMLGVEAEFDIMIPPGDITPANFRSIASIKALVERIAHQAAA